MLSLWQLVKLIEPMAKALEIGAQEFHLRMDEWNNGRKARASVAIARLVWIGLAGDLLAVELDAARDADGVSVLPAVAGLRARGGCLGGAADRKLGLVALAKGFCRAVHCLLAGVVDFRGDQSPHGKLAVSRRQCIHGVRILRAIHVVVLDGHASSV